MLYGRKEVALNRVVCLIKVDGVNLNVGTLKLLQRVIGREDKFVTRSVLGKPANIRRFGEEFVMSFSTMNVQNTIALRINSKNSADNCSLKRILGATTTMVLAAPVSNWRRASQMPTRVLPPPVGNTQMPLECCIRASRAVCWWGRSWSICLFVYETIIAEKGVPKNPLCQLINWI
jgi:hypothetical protein